MPVNRIQAGTYPPESYYVQGFGAVGASLDLYATPTSPAWPIGQKLEAADGRVFRYVQTAGAVNAGQVVSPDLSAVGLTDTDNQVDAAVTAGTRTFRFDGAAFASISANQFSGAFLITTDDAGEGFTYRLSENIASENTDEITVTLTYSEGVVVALATTTDVGIIPNMWAEVVAATAATDFAPSGVAVATMADNDYGWVTTWGPTAVLQDGTIAGGDEVYLSDGVAGAVQVQGGGATFASNVAVNFNDIVAEARVGYCVVEGDDTGQCGIIAQLWP